MRWKDLVVGYLMKVQAGRCADCEAGIHHDYVMKVVFKVDPDDGGREEDIDNVKLIHSDCQVAAIKGKDLRVIHLGQLLRKKKSVRQIAKALKVTERSVYRYLRSISRSKADKRLKK